MSAYYISARGVNYFILRFDDKPAQEMRIPSNQEKRIGVVILQNDDFLTLSNSNRLRAQIGNILNETEIIDLELKGITEAIENIRAKCPNNNVR